MTASLEPVRKELEAAEKQLTDGHMVVLAKMKSGDAKEMTVDEYFESDAEFIKVLRGSNQGEFNRIMNREFDRITTELQEGKK